MTTTLPTPTGRDADGQPWWRLASGERLYVSNGVVLRPETTNWASPDEVEGDGLAYVAAARWARRGASETSINNGER